VKLSTLLELIGSGSILLTVGVGAILLGVGFGFSEATQAPLWVSFCGLGLLAAVVGFVMVDRGSDKAEEHVSKAMSPVVDVLHSPWAGMAAAVIGGIVLQRLLRGKREVIVERPATMPIETAPASPAGDRQPSQSAPEDGFSVSRYLGDQLRSLGSVAAEAAVAMGMQTLGVPSVQDLVRDLLGAEKQENPQERPSPDPDRPEREATAQDEDSNARRSTRPSHNGFNYAEFGAEI
jgi:hypothetical protein